MPSDPHEIWKKFNTEYEIDSGSLAAHLEKRHRAIVNLPPKPGESMVWIKLAISKLEINIVLLLLALKFDSSGNFLMKYGSNGSGDGEFATPKHVAVNDSGNLYVADYGNHRIQKFSTGE